MNTADTDILDFKPVIVERPESLPIPVPARQPRMRFRNFAIVFEIGRSKMKDLHKAIEFAEQLIPLQMKPEVMQKSVKLQHGFTTRQVRSIIRAASPKKHRTRSHGTPT